MNKRTVILSSQIDKQGALSQILGGTKRTICHNKFRLKHDNKGRLVKTRYFNGTDHNEN